MHTQHTQGVVHVLVEIGTMDIEIRVELTNYQKEPENSG